MLSEEFRRNPAALAAMIDHTFLKPFGPPADVESLCQEAVEHGFATVGVNPAEVEHCCALLAGSGVRVGAAIGFPLGQNTVSVKTHETQDAIARGATEIDTVINLRLLKAGQDELVYREIATIVEVCKSNGVISKIILETCYLIDKEKELICRLAMKAGADFVKTSTGFGSAGAKVADVRLMRSVCGPTMGIKASGGIRTLADVLAMIDAGATRIGTSSGVEIMRGLAKVGLAMSPIV
jgi:deoxyribose-phosphate aldolase